MAPRFAERIAHWAGTRRFAALALLLLPLAATTFAALRPRVDSPHGAFKEECMLCHTSAGWTPARVSAKFNHAKYGFPLTGAHATTRCLACHASLDFTQTKKMCVTCHEDPHRAELGTDCARCHGARSFVDRTAMVRAHQSSRFPLTGSHAGLECESCHKPAAQGQMQFVGTQAECQSCHMNDYRATKNPDHAAGSYPVTCTSCHSTISWSPARFDHDRTAFRLTGAHRAAACMKCHGDGVYAGKSHECVSCHQSEYSGTNDPPHASAGFPAAACASCHTTTSWSGAAFDHGATSFPLTGAHRNAACASCHGDGVYNGKSGECVSCHQSDYNRANDPPHAAAGFSLACASCHGTTAWTGATFDHATTAFPLTGAHRTATCVSCHGDGVYAGKPTDCVSCHRSDYDGTTNPGHVAAGFSVACASCHTTTTWSGATFDHDTSLFPIYSGTHRGKWNACADCHTNPGNYATFTCLSCHPHSDRAGTDGHHSGVSGYRYDSQACYSCHPRGRH